MYFKLPKDTEKLLQYLVDLGRECGCIGADCDLCPVEKECCSSLEDEHGNIDHTLRLDKALELLRKMKPVNTVKEI